MQPSLSARKINSLVNKEMGRAMTMHSGKKGIRLTQMFANRLCASVMGFCLFILISNVQAGSLEQAKRIHDRIAGVPPSEQVLLDMKAAIDSDGNGIDAAFIASL
jgi:uncharacterized protein Smg (DUF494 family)